MGITGNISDIKRYAINDGPGIRLTIFLKGCPLSCAWCHNPETISLQSELMYIFKRCIQCGECVRACPKKALTLVDQRIVRDPELCDLCGICTEVCPTLALELVGEQMTPDQLMARIESDRVFFDESGGGVTFSGGEPLMQPEFLLEMLQRCHAAGVHTVVDTSGCGETENLLKIAALTDLFLFDIKLASAERHLKWTGAKMEEIHSNLRRLAKSGAKIIFRMPMINGINCDRENIEKSAALIAALTGGNLVIELLPYHDIAQKKYEQLDREYVHADRFSAPTPRELSAAVLIFARHGIDARVQ